MKGQEFKPKQRKRFTVGSMSRRQFFYRIAPNFFTRMPIGTNLKMLKFQRDWLRISGFMQILAILATQYLINLNILQKVTFLKKSASKLSETLS